MEIKEKNFKTIANQLSGLATIIKDDEDNNLLVLGDEEKFKNIMSEVQELYNNGTETEYEVFYQLIEDKLPPTIGFIII